MTIFRVVSSSPLPEAARIDAIHFDGELMTASCSDASPGGFGGLSLGYSAFPQAEITGWLGDPIDFVDLGHVQVYAGDERGWLVFEGRIKDLDSPTGRQVTALTATGYGAGEMAATTDMWYFSQPYDGEPALGGGALLRDVLQAAAPLLRVGDKDQFYEPGGAYLRSGEDGRYPNQAVDEVVKAGDANNRQVLFAVYEDRVVRLLPRVPPVDEVTGEIVADYFVPADRTRVTWRRTGTQMVGAVAVQFKDPSTGQSGTTAVSSAIEQAIFRDAHGGLLRGYLVPESSWTEAQAEFYRDSYLQRFKGPVLTVMINADNAKWPVYDRMGGAIPGYQVRAGSWIKVADQPPLLVTSTRKDLKAGTTAIVASNV